MGLAASQARFLGLTARKSNVEYQGQQINQARTALANEVAGLYNDYNNLDVPIPPAVADFEKTTYTLDATYEDYEIQNFTKITEGEYAGFYDVTLAWEEEVAKAYSYCAQDSVISAQKGENGYSNLSFRIGLDSYYYDEKDEENSTIKKITGDYDKYQGLTTIMMDQGKTDGTYYMYIKNGIAYYTSEDDLNNTAFEEVDGKDMYYGAYTFDYQGSQKVSKTAGAKAALTQGEGGRLATIQIIESEDLPELVDKSYSISAKREDDQLGYEDAMNDYYYEKANYEKEVEKINLKTEDLQRQDRSLELQLNQLDTEQEALKTEMESISKVIQETIDSVFKTYNS